MTDFAIHPDDSCALWRPRWATRCAISRWRSMGPPSWLPLVTIWMSCRLCVMHPQCRFEQLIDLCGVDYLTYREVGTDGLRFAVVSHLLSVSLNQRLRVKVFADDMPGGPP